MRKVFITAILLLIILFPLSNSINYIQNDEWDWYTTVERYMDGDFSRNTRTAANFYLQGLMAVPFANAFGIEKLPVLTLIVSVLSFMVFGMILDQLLKDKRKVFILSLLYFFIPLNVYSMFGFMTENYFQLFFLLSVFFIVRFNKGNGNKDLLLANLFIVLGYFIRQFSLITSLAFFISLAIARKWKTAIIQLGMFVGLTVYHFWFLPKTTTMFESMVKPELLLNFDRTYSLITIILIYLGMFLLPLLALRIIEYVKSNFKAPKILILSALSLALFLHMGSNFEPNKVETYFPTATKGVVVNFLDGEFPYLGTTFRTNGFYPDLPGNIYDLKYFFDTFRYWENAALILIPLITIVIALTFKKWLNFYGVFLALFTGMLLVSPLVYDRYLIPMVPIVILGMATQINKLRFEYHYIVAAFVLFLAFMNYQYSMEMIQRQNLVWSEASTLVEEENEDPKNISASHAWKMLHHKGNKTYNYYFHYDSPEIFNKDVPGFEIQKTYYIDFPFSIYSSPKIHLYKRI